MTKRFVAPGFIYAAIVAGFTLLYAIVLYFFEPVYSLGFAAVSIVPVSIAAWAYGRRIGILLGVAFIPFTLALTILAGRSPEYFWNHGDPIGFALLPITGYVIGWFKRLNQRLSHELTEQVRLSDLLESERQFNQQIVRNSPDTIYLIDLASRRVVFSNRNFAELLGYERTANRFETINDFTEVLHPADLDHFLKRYLHGWDAVDFVSAPTELRIRHANGQYLTFLNKEAVFEVDASGKPCEILGIASDITERKKNEQKLKFMSTHDSLTGLFNRHYLEEQVAKLTEAGEFPVMVLMSDMDGLKAINDRCGHARGDEVLRQAAEVFLRTVRSSDIVARIGGDEFAVLMPNTRQADAAELVEVLKSRLADYSQGVKDVAISFSMGLAELTPTGDLQEALKQADIRMYNEKKSPGKASITR
jgi:diguanylate cyclase (GGDEF)-like protein/PAS domain S-box-containing protein